MLIHSFVNKVKKGSDCVRIKSPAANHNNVKIVPNNQALRILHS